MHDTPPNAFDAHRSAFSAGLRAAFAGLRVAGRSPDVRTTYAQLVAAIFVLSVWLDACGIWAVWHFTSADPASAWWVVLLLWTLRIAAILLVLLLAPILAFSLVNTFFPMLSERVFFAALRTIAPERAAELQAREGRPFVRGMADNLLRT